ncbi:transmembrane emp24 domain-containing protein p24beta2-like [Apium graveolens]|uniref:transmembrane emp24 domain-containing protein p24beta2-like n=1 Tax=Apium graveolens TaxID=4045 RepID=UPI003D7A7E17
MFVGIIMFIIIIGVQQVEGVRFVIDRQECISHKVDYEGETVHISFVVVKSDAPWTSETTQGVDLVIKGPSDEHIHDFHDKTSEKYEFMAQKRGVYGFCFTNKSPYYETVDFNVLVGHFSYKDQHAKDEHFDPLLEHISKLQEALHNVLFEQHWLEGQTMRQATVNEGLSRRAIHKAMFESAALIGASVLQVYLLQRLFQRKLRTSRV